jgi:hypothetical protein
MPKRNLTCVTNEQGQSHYYYGIKANDIGDVQIIWIRYQEWEKGN